MYYESLCTLYNHWPPALKLCHWPFDEVLLMMMILSFNDDDDNNNKTKQKLNSLINDLSDRIRR